MMKLCRISFILKFVLQFIKIPNDSGHTDSPRVKKVGQIWLTFLDNLTVAKLTNFLA